MTTFDLRHCPKTLEEILMVAGSESVRIVTATGREFILEEADLFEREVAAFGQSDKFLEFLSERAKESERRSLSEVAAEVRH